jgi:hypothetical protein
MPNTIGLRGLKGLNEISQEERNAFMLNNAEKLKAFANRPRLRDEAANILYNNYKFKKKFGIDLFNKMNDGTEDSYNLRNQYFHDQTIVDAFKSTFEKDRNFLELANGLDIQGMYDLMNSKYLTDAERKKELEKNRVMVNEDNKMLEETKKNPLLASENFLQAGMEAAKVFHSLYPYEQDRKHVENNEYILKKLYSDTQERREKEVQGLTDSIYSSLIEANNNGSKTLAQSYKEFDRQAMEFSPHYAQFKNSKWLSGYSNTDRLKDYAKFQALSKEYGKGTAIAYFDRSIQNRVAESQDGEWTNNTLTKAVNTAWSDIGANVAMVKGYALKAGFDVDKIGLLNQGLDPDKPIRDSKGNIIGYAQNDDIWSNPGYWNDVYMYNTVDRNEIALIKQRGGVSPYVNVNKYDYNPNEHFISWGTAQEAFAQSGHLAAALLETLALGGTGKIIGAGAKAGLKAMGMGAKTLSKVSKAGAIANDLLLEAVASTNGPQGEAMGTFNEQIENNKERIRGQINNELQDYYNTIDFNSREAKSAINQYYRELKLKDKQRVTKSTRDSSIGQLPLSDQTLMAQAKQLYTSQLLSAKEKELMELHRKDEVEANRNAAKTYITNWLLDYGKEAMLTHGIQKFKVAKGAMTGALDNSIAESVASDTETGGIKRIAKRLSAKKLMKGVTKQIAGGFADEYFDGINANFSEAMGNNMFDNYIKRNYDPKSYASAVDTMYGNLLAGMSGAVDGITNRENLYEGFIGALSPFATGMVNVGNIAFNPHDTWRAIIKGVDDQGNKIDWAERVSMGITNPLLDEYANAKKMDRDVDATVDAVNKVVSKYKESGGITDAAKAISALADYSTPLENKLYTDKNGRAVSTMLDSEDRKLNNVFFLMDVMDNFSKMEGGTQSKLYQDIMDNMQNLADGNMSDEELNTEIDKFLADDNNKSVLDQPDNREIAAGRLQKNAKYFMDTYKKKQQIDKVFNDSPTFRNMDNDVKTMMKYNLLAEDNYRERLRTLESELGVSSTNTEEAFIPDLSVRYNTDSSVKTAISLRNKKIDELKKKRQELEESNRKSLEGIETLSESNDKEANQKIMLRKNLIDAREFRIKSIDREIEALEREKNTFDEIAKSNATPRVFTKDMILNLDARDRAFVLDKKNARNFTKEQNDVIEQVRNDLMRKDPEATKKIHDAGILANRIADLRDMYSKIMKNDRLAATYLKIQDTNRNREAFVEAMQGQVDDVYNALEKAFANNDDAAFGNILMKSSSDFIKAYQEDHPEQSEKIKPYYDIVKFDEDAAAVIRENDDDDISRRNKIGLVLGIQQGARSKDELISRIEEIIDNVTTPNDVRKFLDGTLSEMKKLGYQRDQTTLENRKERLKREAEEKAKRDAEKARKEAEAKAEADRIAAEKAAKEAKEKAEAEAKATAEKAEKDKLADESKSVKTDEEPDNLVNPEDVAPAGESLSKEEEKKARSNIENAEQKGESSSISLSWANSLMDDSAEEGNAPAGDMWHITDAGPRKEPVTANLKVGDNGKRTITFTNGEQNEEIVIRPEDYEAEAPVQQSKSPNKESSEKQSEGVSLLSTKWVKIDGSGHFILDPSVTINDLKKLSDFDKYFTIVSSETSLQESTGFDFINSGDLGKPDDKGNRRVRRKAQIALRGKKSKEAVVDTEASVQQKPTEQSNKEDEKKQQDNSIENRLFHAKSLEKDGDDWYFVGNFEGEKQETKIKVGKDFDLDKAIDEQRTQREKLYSKQENTIEVNLEEDSEGNVSGINPTLEDQKNSLPDNMEGTIIDTNNADNDLTLNTVGESQEENNAIYNSGNAMAEWNREALQGPERSLERNKDAEGTPKSREKLYAWCDAIGMHIQDIIDHELADILSVNPHAKVKFMATNHLGSNKNTMDDTVSGNLFLVLDFDDSINRGITQIHNDKNGGVIETADGKKYLVIGVFGYAKNNKAQQALYNNLWGKANNAQTRKRKKEAFGDTDPKSQDGYGMIINERDYYFKHGHSRERFYVSPNFSTEIVPFSLIPGWNVHKRPNDPEERHRPIIELMDDEERNPFNITLDNASWAIQERSKFLVVSPKSNQQTELSIMTPVNQERNMGAAFILFPAANGRMFCGHIDPCMYGDMHEGVLKEKVDQLLNDLISSDYDTRVEAIKGLYQIFHFDKESGISILTNRRGQLTLMKNGNIIAYTSYLGESFNREEFIEAFREIKPRVNITARVLGSKKLIKEYSEAGALNTDLAQLSLAGSSYSVFSVNEDGTVNKPTEIYNPSAKPWENSDYSSNRTNVLYYTDGKLATYVYDETKGEYYLNGNLVDRVDNEALIKQLEYNRQVIKGDIDYETEEKGYKYYIINDTDNPLVIKIDGYYHVTELSPKDSKDYIDRRNKSKENMRREEAAKQALADMENVEDVDLENNLIPDIIANKDNPNGDADAVYIDSIDEDGNHHLDYAGSMSGQRILTLDIIEESKFVPELDIEEIRKLNNNPKITETEVQEGFSYRNSWPVESVVVHPNGEIDLIVYIGFNVCLKGVREMALKIFPELQQGNSNTGSVVEGNSVGTHDEASREKDRDKTNNEGKGEKGFKASSTTKPGTQTFEELYTNKIYKMKVMKAIRTKWPDAPKDIVELPKYLQEKGVEVSSIGTSKDDIQTWIDTLTNCK